MAVPGDLEGWGEGQEVDFTIVYVNSSIVL